MISRKSFSISESNGEPKESREFELEKIDLIPSFVYIIKS